jgi:beta-lactam-binding protein with PASTA domain/transcriptional regulator with XRE-family HTH domain
MDDKSVGAMLRAAREAQGITLAKAETATRIRQKYLAALEENRSEDLPEPVFVKGFIRNYAIFLGLDPEHMLEQYRVEHNLKKDVADVQPEIEPIRTPSRLSPALLTLGLALAVFLLVTYYLYQQYAAPPALPTPTLVLTIPTPTPTPAPTVLATRVPTPVQQDVPVPDVSGMTLTEADDALQKTGLRLEVLERQFSDTAAANVVLSQTVKPLTKVRQGSVIGVTLSRGSQMVSVPRLVGLAYNDAVARLAAAGLRVQRNEVSAQGAPNTVVGQDPVENAQVQPNSTVKLTVSVGDVMSVPNVYGLPQEQAKDALLKAGLVIGQISFQGPDRVPMADLLKVCKGCVLSTDPPVGRIVPRGTVINMGVRSE